MAADEDSSTATENPSAQSAPVARVRKRRKPSEIPAVEHYRNAHRLAFAPLTFHGVLLARDNGLLASVEAAGSEGIRPEDAAKIANVSYYAARVLLEACLSMDLVFYEDGRYTLSHGGSIMLHDEMTRVNMNFVRDVCYQGASKLEASLAESRPVGLEHFGPWPTIYEGLAHLPQNVRKSWLEYDHAYSDRAFPVALPIVLAEHPKRLLDVGGNTGKWSLQCTKADANIEVTLVDHPGQLKFALENAAAAGVAARVNGVPMDLLNHAVAFPTGFDVVWMSQFLDCFQESDVVSLLKRARAALAPGGTLFILEPYWDHQHVVGRDSVIGLSLYFACMANGNSRMYHSDDMRKCVQEAGLVLAQEHRLNFHTLFACKSA